MFEKKNIRKKVYVGVECAAVDTRFKRHEF